METSFNGSNFGDASYLANPDASDWGNYGSEEDPFAAAAGRIDAKEEFSNPKNTPLPLVKQGATDAQVKQAAGITGLVTRIQQALVEAAILSPSNVSGTFDKNTHDAVVEFQQVSGIDVDGKVGPQTYKKFGWSDKVAQLSKAKVQATSAVVVTQEMAPMRWYKRSSTMYIGGAILTAAVLGILFWPKGK